jgi:hypothetical protein
LRLPRPRGRPLQAQRPRYSSLHRPNIVSGE